MVKKAQDQNVDLDPELIQQVLAFSAKILAERNLRK
jgi:hypothetical protein